MVKEFLGRQRIPFSEVDVSSDAVGRREMIEKTGQVGVPVVIVDGAMVIGFDQAKLEKLIEE